MKNVLEYLETTAARLPEAAAYIDETQTVTFSALPAVEWQQKRGLQIRKSLERRSIFVQWLCILLPLAILTAVIAFSGKPVSAALIYQNN